MGLQTRTSSHIARRAAKDVVPATQFVRRPPRIPFRTAAAQPAAPARKWDFSRIAIHPPDIRQGGPDGLSHDGEDDYPRQEATAPPTTTPASVPRQAPAGTYASPPTAAQIIADPEFSRQLQRAWTESLPNAPNVPRGSAGSSKREQGGWVLWRRDSHIIQIIRVPPGTRDGLGTIVGTRPPDSDVQRVVAWFHTHPNTAAEGYGTQASVGDTSWQNSEAKVPGIIMTHAGVVTIPYP